MTVNELIEELKKYNGDLKVFAYNIDDARPNELVRVEPIWFKDEIAQLSIDIERVRRQKDS